MNDKQVSFGGEKGVGFYDDFNSHGFLTAVSPVKFWPPGRPPNLRSFQEFIDIVETIYRGARKGRGLVMSPKAGDLVEPTSQLKDGFMVQNLKQKHGQ